MKLLLSVFALILSSASAFAGGAVGYNCVGQDQVSQSSVMFELMFSESAPEVGYTNQSITVMREGSSDLESPVTFQMREATSKNNCTKNSMGEIYLSNDFNMTPLTNGYSGYEVTFKSDCTDAKYDVKAICLFEYNP